MMNKKRRRVIQLGHALFFAAAMIIAALLLAGTEYQQTVPGLIFYLWCSTFLLFQENRCSIKNEWACIRKFFRSTPSARNE